jgi:hypothetical protein
MFLKSAEVCLEEVRSVFCLQNRKLLPKEERSHIISSPLGDLILHITVNGAGGIRTRTEYYSSGF